MNAPIPGTTLFDGAQARKGYALNKVCFSFSDAQNRAEFLVITGQFMLADGGGYLH